MPGALADRTSPDTRFPASGRGHFGAIRTHESVIRQGRSRPGLTTSRLSPIRPFPGPGVFRSPSLRQNEEGRVSFEPGLREVPENRMLLGVGAEPLPIGGALDESRLEATAGRARIPAHDRRARSGAGREMAVRWGKGAHGGYGLSDRTFWCQSFLFRIRSGAAIPPSPRTPRAARRPAAPARATRLPGSPGARPAGARPRRSHPA